MWEIHDNSVDTTVCIFFTYQEYNSLPYKYIYETKCKNMYVCVVCVGIYVVNIIFFKAYIVEISNAPLDMIE